MFCGDVISPYTTIGKSDPNTNPMALVAHDKCATVGKRVCVCGIQNVQRDSELSINNPLSVSYGDIKCLLWSARRVQPLAELNQAERSEA